MACSYARNFDDETGRWECASTGSECFYLIPSSKGCAERFGEGPDVDEEEADKKGE